MLYYYTCITLLTNTVYYHDLAAKLGYDEVLTSCQAGSGNAFTKPLVKYMYMYIHIPIVSYHL